MASSTSQQLRTDVQQGAKKGVKSLKGFFTKFNNDWVMNFASALAFNLITAILPILIAIVAIAGFTVGNLSPSTEAQLINHLGQIFPSSGDFVKLAFKQLNKSAGPLAIIAILLAIFGGSRLFISMEGYFDIIYHVRPRGVIRQNIMAIVMLLIFIILIVPMVLAASVPAAIQSIASTTPLGPLTSNSFVNWLVSIIVSLFISWVLFLAIFIVVPNQHISFRNSRLGALIAAILLEIYIQLFPLYVTHFLGSYTGNIALVVVLLFFFYYFAVILMIGAEINAYYAEGIQVTPDNLAVMVHKYTSHLATSEKDVQEQAPPSHKGEEPIEIVPANAADQPQSQEQQTNTSAP
ncbi:MAG TPA: YihY/virulence factor BrkB family protein [Ktedonobacteraceae bacterium]|nr:YihY/virulence factor BrkB family protein [Ktedonobacteraceae bacterium]